MIKIENMTENEILEAPSNEPTVTEIEAVKLLVNSLSEVTSLAGLRSACKNISEKIGGETE